MAEHRHRSQSLDGQLPLLARLLKCLSQIADLNAVLHPETLGQVLSSWQGHRHEHLTLQKTSAAGSQGTQGHHCSNPTAPARAPKLAQLAAGLEAQILKNPNACTPSPPRPQQHLAGPPEGSQCSTAVGAELYCPGGGPALHVQTHHTCKKAKSHVQAYDHLKHFSNPNTKPNKTYHRGRRVKGLLQV